MISVGGSGCPSLVRQLRNIIPTLKGCSGGWYSCRCVLLHAYLGVTNFEHFQLQTFSREQYIAIRTSLVVQLLVGPSAGIILFSLAVHLCVLLHCARPMDLKCPETMCNLDFCKGRHCQSTNVLDVFGLYCYNVIECM